MFTKVTAFQAINGTLCATREEAIEESVGYILSQAADQAEEFTVKKLVTTLKANPQVLDWLVEQVKGKQEEPQCEDCGSTLFIHRNAQGNPTHASGCTCP